MKKIQFIRKITNDKMNSLFRFKMDSEQYLKKSSNFQVK